MSFLNLDCESVKNWFLIGKAYQSQVFIKKLFKNLAKSIKQFLAGMLFILKLFMLDFML